MKNNNFSPMDDKEFLEGIWRKTRYIEYLKVEEEIVRANKANIYKRKVKTIIWMSLCALLAIIPIIMIFGSNLFSIILIGLIFMGEGTFYEYIQSLNGIRRKSS
jgi:hypothetical protein